MSGGVDGEGIFRSGVCSWTDPSLIKCGRFYKNKSAKKDELLKFYSSKMPCVEVDASTYTVPTVNRVQKWNAAAPKGFIFHFKAHQLFTHQSTDYAKLPRLIRDGFPHPGGPQASEIALSDVPEAIQEQMMFLFNLALKEVQAAQKLGVAVFQFPESYSYSPENMQWIVKLRKWLDADIRMAIEFRSKSWFFDANDFAAMKQQQQPEPQTTDIPTARLQETLNFVRSNPNMMLIAIDEYVKRDVKPTAAVPHPARVVPILTQVTLDEVYIRVHRRVGEDRLLTDAEIQNWDGIIKRIVALNPQVKRIWMLWNTNHEMQAFENAAKLDQALGAKLVFDWKKHYTDVQKANPGSIFSFFGKAPAKKADAQLANNNNNNNNNNPDQHVADPSKRGADVPIEKASEDASAPKKAKPSPPPKGGIGNFFKKQ